MVAFTLRILARAWLRFLKAFRTPCEANASGFWLGGYSKTHLISLRKLVDTAKATWLVIVSFSALDEICEESAGAPILDFVDECIAGHIEVNL